MFSFYDYKLFLSLVAIIGNIPRLLNKLSFDLTSPQTYHAIRKKFEHPIEHASTYNHHIISKFQNFQVPSTAIMNQRDEDAKCQMERALWT